MSAEPSWRLAVDVGGTFIDYVLLDETTGAIRIDKQPANAASLVDEFMTGVERLPVKPGEIAMLIHGTTVATNALVQERGAKTGLLTTAGFRDVLELGRGGRPEIYNLRYQPAKPLVPRHLRREITERVNARGDVLVAIDDDEVLDQARFLVAQGVTAIAICFLHSYANGKNEQRVADLIRRNFDGIAVSVSSELVREWREFERSSTTVINAFLEPQFAGYANAIEDRIRSAGLKNEIAFMRSSGGVMPIESAANMPVDTLGSGPGGGVIGAHALMSAAGHENVVCADVGGTTYDVALIHNGEIVERSRTEIAGRPIIGSVIDVVSVGAGGGSIATIDRLSGSLRVGPESAGAQPGPACFGKGGDHPTVTDAQVVLNLLDPERFLDGRMTLDRSLAEAAIRRDLGEDRDIIVLADGILAIAQANMANAIRQITTQRGLDPREFVMLSYGGGGGLFAAGVALELGIKKVLIPQAAAGFSAWGMLAADYREDVTITRVRDVSVDTTPDIIAEFEGLAEEARSQFVNYGFSESVVEVKYSADIRFIGQEHTITTPIDLAWFDEGGRSLPDKLQRRFVERHRQRYGHGSSDSKIQIVTARCRALAPVQRPKMQAALAASAAQPVAHRDIWFSGYGWRRNVPVYERGALAADDRVRGPAVVDEWTTTVIVPPQWESTVDAVGNLVLDYMGG